jgi:two-component system, response regulator PdtaR
MNRPNILVVEDEAIVAVDVEECLQTLGYNVCGSAAEGVEAVGQAEKLKPDLVLMDIMLQGEVDGIKAAQMIKEKTDIRWSF